MQHVHGMFGLYVDITKSSLCMNMARLPQGRLLTFQLEESAHRGGADQTIVTSRHSG